MNNVQNLKSCSKINLIYIINDIFILTDGKEIIQCRLYRKLISEISRSKKNYKKKYIDFINSYIEKYMNNFYCSYIVPSRRKQKLRKVNSGILEKDTEDKMFDWKKVNKQPTDENNVHDLKKIGSKF